MDVTDRQSTIDRHNELVEELESLSTDSPRRGMIEREIDRLESWLLLTME